MNGVSGAPSTFVTTTGLGRALHAMAITSTPDGTSVFIADSPTAGAAGHILKATSSGVTDNYGGTAPTFEPYAGSDYHVSLDASPTSLVVVYNSNGGSGTAAESVSFASPAFAPVLQFTSGYQTLVFDRDYPQERLSEKPNPCQQEVGFTKPSGATFGLPVTGEIYCQYYLYHQNSISLIANDAYRMDPRGAQRVLISNPSIPNPPSFAPLVYPYPSSRQ